MYWEVNTESGVLKPSPAENKQLWRTLMTWLLRERPSGSWSKFCNRSNMLNEGHSAASNVHGLTVNSEFIKGKWCIFIDILQLVIILWSGGTLVLLSIVPTDLSSRNILLRKKGKQICPIYSPYSAEMHSLIKAGWFSFITMCCIIFFFDCNVSSVSEICLYVIYSSCRRSSCLVSIELGNVMSLLQGELGL